MRSAWFVVTGLIIVLAVPAANAQKPERLAVGYGSISTNYLPLWMAKEAGIFRKNGLDVDTVFFTSSPTAFMALLAGETAITINPGPDVVNAHLAGGRRCFCRRWNCGPRLVACQSTRNQNGCAIARGSRSHQPVRLFQ
jgi:ABC-type nitrate/sulfonate/bicarbonate transport system substrate-binding protein